MNDFALSRLQFSIIVCISEEQLDAWLEGREEISEYKLARTHEFIKSYALEELVRLKRQHAMLHLHVKQDLVPVYTCIDDLFRLWSKIGKSLEVLGYGPGPELPTTNTSEQGRS